MGLGFGDTILKVKESFDAALSSSPEMEKKLRQIVRDEIAAARAGMVNRARNALGSDPRGAAQSVRSSVYKSLLGGQVNILEGRGGGGSSSYSPARTLREGQRGGNRRPRSARTEQVDGYGPGQRGFILRFVNSGTSERQTRYGNRGSIAARNWFRTAGDAELNAAAERIARVIEEELSMK
jgi:hypothetical protein